MNGEFEEYEKMFYKFFTKLKALSQENNNLILQKPNNMLSYDMNYLVIFFKEIGKFP